MSGKKYGEDNADRIIKKVTEHVDQAFGLALEKIDGRFALQTENLGAIIDSRIRPIVREELVEVKDDTKTIKQAVTDTNKQIQDHEHRLTRLEAAA